MDTTGSVSSLWKAFRLAGGLALLWNLVLTIGGLVMLTFVVTNGFLPELDLSGAITLLASASLVSIFLIFAVGALTFAGGWVLYSWFEKIDSKVRGRTSAVVAILSAITIYSVLTFVGEAPILVQSITFALLGLMVTGSFAAVLRDRRRNREWTKERGLIFGAFVVGTLFALLNTIVFTQLYRVRSGGGDAGQWATLALWLAVQATCIGAVASSRTSAALFKISGAFGAAGFLFLLMLSNNPTFVVARMAQLLSIGNLPNISLAVTQEGCQILHTLSKGALCEPVSDKSVYLVGPITLRSRFGKQMLIEYTSNGSVFGPTKQAAHEVVLQATEVLGWERRRATN